MNTEQIITDAKESMKENYESLNNTVRVRRQIADKAQIPLNDYGVTLSISKDGSETHHIGRKHNCHIDNQVVRAIKSGGFDIPRIKDGGENITFRKIVEAYARLNNESSINYRNPAILLVRRGSQHNRLLQMNEYCDIGGNVKPEALPYSTNLNISGIAKPQYRFILPGLYASDIVTNTKDDAFFYNPTTNISTWYMYTRESIQYGFEEKEISIEIRDSDDEDRYAITTMVRDGSLAVLPKGIIAIECKEETQRLSAA